MDFSPVNLLEKEIPFFFFSPNHQLKLLHSLPHFIVSCTHFTNATSGEEFGRTETTVAVRSLAWSVYWVAIVRRAENHCCQALLVLWSGSALAKSTYLPKGATNSCLDFSLAINLVTSALFSFRISKLYLKLRNFLCGKNPLLVIPRLTSCFWSGTNWVTNSGFVSLVHIGKRGKVNWTVI